MPETTWKLDLKGNAGPAAKRAHREVAALVRVLRDLKDVAGPAERALGGVAGPATIRNLRTQIGLTRELGRELKKNNAEGRRGRSPASGGGRTRVDGMSTDPRALAAGVRFQQRARELQRRHGAQQVQQVRRDRSAEALAHQGFFQRQSRMTQRSFRENERIRAGERRAEQQRATRVARGGREGLSSMLGMGASGASALYGGIASIVSTTLSAVAAVAGLAAGFAGLSLMIGGALLQLIAFREGTLMTLATLMRVPGEESMTPAQRRGAREVAAAGELGWAQQFGRETPLSTRQVVELRTQASTAGYQGDEARTMTMAAADAGALHPNDASTASRFMLQMGQLRNSSVARSADYRPAAQAAGVSETAAMRRAAIAAGVVQRDRESESAYQTRIRNAQGNGQITGRQMHDAILAEQRAQLGGGSGDFARSQSGSMAAVLSNLGEGFEAFVTSIANIERLPGVLALKALLTQMADTLAGITRNGKNLQGAFAGGLNRVAGFLGTIFESAGGFDSALTQAMETAKQLWPIVTGVLGAFREGFMEGFGPFIRELRSGAGEFMASGGHDLIQWAREFGRGLGLISVFMLRVTGAVITLGAQAVAGVGPLYDLLAALQGIVAQLQEARAMANTIADPFGAARAAAWESIMDFFGIGERMGDGVAAGFRSQQGHMQREISSVMASLPATARTDMQIKSPSRVMAEIGQYMAEGVTVGLDSGASGVQSAMSNVVAPPSLGSFGGALGGMGGPSISLVVQVQGGASADETGAIVGESVVEHLTRLFGQMQLAGGA